MLQTKADLELKIKIKEGEIYVKKWQPSSDSCAAPIIMLHDSLGSVDLWKGVGIGQELVRYGLEHLKSLNIDLVFTYGDPGYYSKVGFQTIAESIVEAPCPLSQPIGWLVQSLDGSPILTMNGSTQCVQALNDPSLW